MNLANPVAGEQGSVVSVFKIKTQRRMNSSLYSQPSFVHYSSSDTIGEVYRDLFRDWKLTIEKCENINDWLVPCRLTATAEAIRDYILTAIPHGLQGDFCNAYDKGDFNAVGEILAFTVYGNANIVSQSSRWKALTDRTDLIHVVFRLFMNMVPILSASKDSGRQFNLLFSINQFRQQVLCARLKPECYQCIMFRFTIVLLSTAARNPSYYCTDLALSWLRSCFKEAIETANEPGTGNKSLGSQKKLVLFWICTLWAGTMHAMGPRFFAEAIALLRKLKYELCAFRSIECPYSVIVNQLLVIVLANLAQCEKDEATRLRMNKKIFEILNTRLTLHRYPIVQID
jgi:hypothetical protein